MKSPKTMQQAIVEQGVYPREAFDFVQRGLKFTAECVHRSQTDPQASRHVSGQQLCEGLRLFALSQWGLLARAVLAKWNIYQTDDFGRIVFTLIELGEMSKTDDDTIEDFHRVYDFSKAFEAGYRIDLKPTESRT